VGVSGVLVRDEDCWAEYVQQQAHSREVEDGRLKLEQDRLALERERFELERQRALQPPPAAPEPLSCPTPTQPKGPARTPQETAPARPVAAAECVSP